MSRVRIVPGRQNAKITRGSALIYGSKFKGKNTGKTD